MKKILSLLLAFAVLLSVTACSPSDTAKDTVPASPDAELSTPDTTPVQSHYPITVTDQASREVTIENQPEKLVSGYYISTSLLIALGLDEKLVGIEAKADKRAIYQRSAPELIDLPNVGTAKEFDLEGCAALEPDLVLLPLKLKSAAETLEALGMDVLLVNPESQELLTEMIHLVASATDTEEKAQSLLTFISEQEAFLADALEGADAPRVYFAGNSNILSTAGKAMYQADMIRMAGGENVADEIEDTYWSEIDYEQLLTWNPEYIILASDAAYTVEDVLNDRSLADCTAVINGNVYQLPNKAEAWDSPVPSGILGSVWLANVLHADKVSDGECASRIDEYYETFYHFTYSEN
ncbi:MAG: ABC transporter substrate-binding protein [Eubacteriales bacterium]